MQRAHMKLQRLPSDGRNIRFLQEYKSALAEHSRLTGYDSPSGMFNYALLASEVLNERPMSIEFSFWMPSLRYVERNMLLDTTFQPCEAGRPTPAENECAVQLFILCPGFEGSKTTRYPQDFRDNENFWPDLPAVYYVFESDFSAIDLCKEGDDCWARAWEKENDVIIFL